QHVFVDGAPCSRRWRTASVACTGPGPTFWAARTALASGLSRGDSACVDDELGILAAGYQAGLQRFVDVGDEADLEAAHAFSQAAFRAERTVLDVVDVHSRAVQELSGRPASSRPTLPAAGVPV